jgi:hypothetical protein
VLDADIRPFFESIDHGWMRRFIEHRIADRRLVRLLMKWLRAGVLGLPHKAGPHVGSRDRAKHGLTRRSS